MKLENQYLWGRSIRRRSRDYKIYNKEDGTDIIWEGNPEFWKRHSPFFSQCRNIQEQDAD